MQEQQRLEYLRAMGIEVWCNKNAPMTQESCAREQADPAIAGSLLKEGIADHPTDIGLYLVKYPNCLAVIDLPASQSNLASGCQQLLDDVVKTLGVDSQKRTVIRETEDLRSDGADEMLRGRVVQLLGGANSFLLVFGDMACRLLLAKDVEEFAALDWMGRKAVAGKGLESLLQSSALKRSLWLSLQQHLSGH
jgi:hypothetical protein